MLKNLRATLVSFALATACIFGGFMSSAHAAATVHVPDSFLFEAVTGVIDLDTDTIKCGLTAPGYTHDRVNHSRRSHVTEVTGTGYTAGGQTCTLSVVKDTTNHKLVITMPQIQWSGATVTARGVYVYKSTGVAANDPLIGYAQYSTDITSTNGTFTAPLINFEFSNY
jgi:hypothetical protein